MKVTVVIATCNRPERLARGLDAIAAAVRAAGGGHPVVVVDNGARAPAAATVEEQARKTGMPVRYLTSPPSDKTRALNAGIAAAGTDWIAFTDDDTVPDPTWILEGLRFAERGGFRIFGGRVIPGQPDRPLPRWLTPGRSGRAPGIGVFVGYEPLPASGRLGPRDTIPFGANIFVRKEVFERYGGYDESLWALCPGWPVGVEDTEFGYRVRAAGEPVGYCREAVVMHPVHHELCSRREHFRRAYYDGWRQPLIFFDPKRPVLEAYRLRLILRHLGGALADQLRDDPAGAAYHLVELLRVAGALVGRWSGAYRQRAADLRSRPTLPGVS